MTEVLFYHLERTRLDNVLPNLLEKSLQLGWRATVKATSPEVVDEVNALLWTYTEESFLPHGTDGDGADHPIFITQGDGLGGKRDILFLIDGAEAENETVSGLTRCIRIFDGGDEKAVSAARAFWKQVKDAGHEATYWRQSPQGRWEKQG